MEIIKHLIVGYGEVGKAINSVFTDADIVDLDNRRILKHESPYNVMHVCFPYSESFIDYVEGYKNEFKPDLVIVHSSVPVGTCAKLRAVHSPVRGVHPHLEKGIRTFLKYFGGADVGAITAADIFENNGIKTCVISDSKTTEAAKLWDTTQYGVMILLEKEIHKFCKENDVDFDTVYRHFNESYNEGYTKLDMSHVVRPSLIHMDGPIGGHCVVQNAHLLDTPSAKRIINENTQL